MELTVFATGGTIASTDGTEGASPTKTGEELVDAVPELSDYAEITVEEVAQTPSYELDAETLETLAARVADRIESGEAGAVVVTHGTDTMEETAYYLDAALAPSIPVFLTGAQRRPDEPSPDGPANLLTACRAAAAFVDADGSGTFVAFNEEIHAARAVSKYHTSNVEAFRSGDAGPVATVDHTGVRVHRAPKSESTHVPSADLGKRVCVVKSGVGVDGSALRDALDRGVDGVVVEGTGLGNVTGPLASAIGEAVDGGVPAVVTSRCFAGSTAPVYGSNGGGERLARLGAISGGDLPAHKARIKLQLALSAYDEGDEIRAAFEG